MINCPFVTPKTDGSEGNFPALEQLWQVTANSVGSAFFAAVCVALSRLLPNTEVLYATASDRVARLEPGPESADVASAANEGSVEPSLPVEIRSRASGGKAQHQTSRREVSTLLERVLSLGHVLLPKAARDVFPDDPLLEASNAQGCIAVRAADSLDGDGAVLLMSQTPLSSEVALVWLNILKSEISRERSQRATRWLRVTAELSAHLTSQSPPASKLEKLCQVLQAELGVPGVGVYAPKSRFVRSPVWIARGALSESLSRSIPADPVPEEMAWLATEPDTVGVQTPVLCLRVG
ncbi:MAG TPA: hypothetical protein VFQ61_25265, partial [Polyangiaceae bacterium]|nr:hypothetical protein [Polyangiaceae bacterium]